MTDASVKPVERKRKRPAARWMPGERLKGLRHRVTICLSIAGQAGAAFLLCFADVMSIPSGMHAAYLTALAARGESLLWPICGCVLSLVMRLIWGLPLPLLQPVTWLFLLLAPRLVFGKGALRLLIVTAVSLLPDVTMTWLTSAPANGLTATAGLVMAALSAPVFYRGLGTLRSKHAIDTLEERLAAGYLIGMMLCGGGRMMLFGVNIGVLGAAVVTLCMAQALGTSAGLLSGMTTGMTLALQGLPMSLCVCLAMGGMLAGAAQVRARRWLTCGTFAAGTVIGMLLSGASALGSVGGVCAATLLCLMMPGTLWESVCADCRRFRAADVSGDAYATMTLARWERTVDAMAHAVPDPAAAEHDPVDWHARLCDGCPDQSSCACMNVPLATLRAQSVWDQRHQPDAMWAAALEDLRGMGCGRLYHLRDRMTALRQEEDGHLERIRRACYERDMLTTHLAAMAGAARRFALLSGGSTWWDAVTSRKMRDALAELAFPAELLYARRVQGHAEVAFQLNTPLPSGQLTEDLCRLTADVLDAPMAWDGEEAGRVRLRESPIFRIEAGSSSVAMMCREELNGDTVLLTSLEDGRFFAALSDGMGHGLQAHRESGQTVRLLQLCLDAGYTRSQALTAVNGMMLTGTQGERFATVDLLTVDPWTGNAALDKLGAASGYLVQDGTAKAVCGDSLPLGIMEQITTSTTQLKLKDGDRFFLLSDGVEDAFPEEQQLADAVAKAAACDDPGESAAHLLDAARAKSHSALADDMTAAVVRIVREERGERGGRRGGSRAF